MLKNLRLGTRLGVGFGCVILIFIVISIVVFSLLSQVREQATFIRDVNIPKTKYASQMMDSMYQMRLSMRDVVFHHGDRAVKDGELIVKHRSELIAHMDEFDRLLKIRSQDKEVQIMNSMREGIAASVPLQDQLTKYGIADNDAEATVILDKIAEILGPAITHLENLIEFENELNAHRAEEIATESSQAIMSIVISTAIAVVLAMFAAFLVTRSITQPIRRMIETVEAMAGGDLSRTIVAESRDEIGTLQSALGRMSDNLARMIGEVRTGAKQLVSSATELSGAATDVRKGSELQSEAASAMAAALEEMSTSINHVSSLSEDARQTSVEAGHTAHSGSDTIHSMVGEIRQVAEAIGEGAVKAQQLGQESERISAIVHVIRDVADQTNLLALNAAIEAARAGEQGRGFAVVADEVRKLAEKTTSSAQEITEMVGSIQAGATAMSTQMETTAKRMQEGMELAQKAGGAIGEIDTGAQNVVHMIDDVSSALKEQATASHDIAGRVEQIVQMVEENSSAIGSVANSAEQLNALATTLRSGVERFRVAG